MVDGVVDGVDKVETTVLVLDVVADEDIEVGVLVRSVE